LPSTALKFYFLEVDQTKQDAIPVVGVAECEQKKCGSLSEQTNYQKKFGVEHGERKVSGV
jgi:hypothetical protein